LQLDKSVVYYKNMFDALKTPAYPIDYYDLQDIMLYGQTSYSISNGNFGLGFDTKCIVGIGSVFHYHNDVITVNFIFSAGGTYAGYQNNPTAPPATLGFNLVCFGF